MSNTGLIDMLPAIPGTTRASIDSSPAAPSVTQLRAPAGQLFVHPLARARFAVDAQTTRPDPQNIPAAVLQIDSRDEEIRSSQHRIDVLAQRFRNSFPPLARHAWRVDGPGCPGDSSMIAAGRRPGTLSAPASLNGWRCS